MNNFPTEQIIKITAPKKALIFKVIMIIACILAATTIPSTYVIGMILLVVFIAVTVLVFKYYNAEYEYSLNENELTIDRIASRSMRKRCGVFNVGRATLIAKPDSQDAMRMEHQKLTTEDYTSNSNPDQVVVVYAMNGNNELVRIFVEPDEKMLKALKEAAPKTSFKMEITEA